MEQVQPVYTVPATQINIPQADFALSNIAQIEYGLGTGPNDTCQVHFLDETVPLYVSRQQADKVRIAWNNWLTENTQAQMAAGGSGRGH